MPKRTGLGQRGLDLLISSSPGKTPESEETNQSVEKSSSGKKKSTAGRKTIKAAAGDKPAASGKEQSASKGRKSESIKEKSKSANSKASGNEKAVSSEKSKKAASKKASGSEKAISSKMSTEKTKVSDGNSSVEEKDNGEKVAEAVREASQKGEPVMVPISMVEPNRQQPRKNFDEDALQELAESIRQFGIIQPLIVQEKDGYYEIIAGERRWRAARIVSLKELPVIIRDYTPREVMEISLIENIQREDLNPIEEAGAYRRLMEEYKLKQDEVAERVSKSRAAIANAVRLLNLDQRVQDMIIAQMLSTGHARALLAISDPELQFQTAQKVFDEKLTVRDVERLVRKMNEAPTTHVKRQISDALQAVYNDLAEKMKSSLGTKVSIAPKSSQKGKIEIEYYSADELDRLCTLLNSLSQKEGM